MEPTERREKIRAILDRVAERLEREWPEGEAHINELEDLSERVGREVMRELTAELLREQSPRRPGNQSTCACGQQAFYRGDYPLTLVTAHGRLPVQRAYFYCAHCATGHCPLDQEWGLGPAHTTPTVQNIVGGLAAALPYVQVPALLRRVGTPVHLGVKSIERIAQRLGERVQHAPPAGPAPSGRMIAAAVDGVMVPTWAGSKQARCGVIYEPDWGAGRTPAAEAGLRKEYVGTLTSREDLMREVCTRVEQRRASPATLVGALGDGAKWIWAGYEQHLPHRVEVLDFYHVVEPLGVVGTAWHGEATPAATEWVKQQKKKRLRYGPNPLLRTLRAWQPTGASAAAVKRQELGYFENNRQRMDYPHYLALGLPIGSGAVEGACKHLVGDRFKGAGMRWKADTAEPLLHLRAALLTHPDLDLRRYAATPLPG